MVVADLSLVQNYRGSFETEVRKGGIDGLIKALVDKNQQLSAGPATAEKK
jgi:phospholipid transport system substrate-binding protein